MTDRAELLEAALDTFAEGIALVGAEGRIVFWNISSNMRPRLRPFIVPTKSRVGLPLLGPG